MKKISAFLVVMFTVIPVFAQRNNQDRNQPASGSKQETKITPDASGVKRSIGYRFSSLLTAENPGDGTFRLNSGTIGQVTYLIVDNNDLTGEDQTKWYSTWDDTTGAMARGQITLVESGGKNIIKFDVSGLFSRANGFWKIPVTYVSGTIPANGSIYYYVFERIDHKKEQAEKQKPAEETKPVEQPKPVDEVTPVEQPKPVAEVKPVEQPRPVEEIKPAEQPKPVAELKPVEQAKPVEEVKPVEQPKPVVELKPVEQAKPVEEAKPVEQPKPVAEVKPVEQTKPVADVKPTEQPKPVAEIKPAEQPKTVEEAKPAGEHKPVDQSRPVNRKTSSEVATNRQEVTEKQTTAQRTGTTFTSTITQGVQPEQGGNAPPSYQSNLPTYQYRYSTGKRSRGKCYAGIIEIGYGLGMSDYGTDNFRFNFINGFHIGPTFTAGLGIGVRRYYFDHENFTEYSPVSGKIQIPVFLDLRKTFSTRTVTPYLAFGIGNSARFAATSGSSDPVQEGLLMNASGGIWFNISSRFAVFFGAAYESQKMEFRMLSDDSHFKKNAGSVSLNAGIAF